MRSFSLKSALAPFSRRRNELRMGASAGLAGGITYLIEMKWDLLAFDYNTDDRILLGGVLLKREPSERLLGTAIHLGNSVIVGVVYESLVQERLGGPGWLRGVAFASAENLGLYSLLRFENVHPAIRDGRLDSYWTAVACAQGVLRHLAFGATMGWMADRLRCRLA